MTLFVLTPETVMNPAALKTGSVPRKHLHRVAILPRREGGLGLTLRLIAENEPLRYILALTPFIAPMLIWQDMALPISQAPLLMIMLVGFIELRVLRIPKHKREKVTSETAAAQTLDTLAFRARQVLAQIAARRPETEGEMMLVVEQSELAGIAPLTLVSVQTAHPRPRVIDLDAEDRAVIRAGLFVEGFTERALHKANIRQNEFLRSIAFDLRGVSGHARLDALLARPSPEAAPA